MHGGGSVRIRPRQIPFSCDRLAVQHRHGGPYQRPKSTEAWWFTIFPPSSARIRRRTTLEKSRSRFLDGASDDRQSVADRQFRLGDRAGRGAAPGLGFGSVERDLPAGARSVSLTAFETKTAGGTVIDGYMDNIVLDLTAVPVPTIGQPERLAGRFAARGSPSAGEAR